MTLAPRLASAAILLPALLALTGPAHAQDPAGEPAIVVLIDSPGDGRVQGTVPLSGRTVWSHSGAPAAANLSVTMEERDADGRTVASWWEGDVASDGAWTFTLDTERLGSTGGLRGDGTHVFQVGSRWNGVSATTPCPPGAACPPQAGVPAGHRMVDVRPDAVTLDVRNDLWVAVEDVQVTLHDDELVEGEPVLIDIQAWVRSGFRPTAILLGVSHAVRPDNASAGGGGAQVAGVGAAVHGAVDGVEETSDGFRAHAAVTRQWFPTVGWTEDDPLQVEVLVRRGDESFPAGVVQRVPVRVEPAASEEEARERSQQSYQAWWAERSSGGQVAPAAAAAATGVVGMSTLALAGTEAGRYALRALPAGLFSRITGPRVLEQRSREAIHAYVQARPGARLRDVRAALGMSSGGLAHHVRTLQREGLLRVVRRGGHLHVYAGDVRAPLREIEGRSAQLLRVVGRAPGITQAEAARRLGTSRQTLHYHVRSLRDLGVLAVAAAGRESRLSVAGTQGVLACSGCRAAFLGTSPQPCPRCGAPLAVGEGRPATRDAHPGAAGA